MAAVTWTASSVGTWIEKPLSLNATTPIRTVAGWRSTNARAAALAASIRVGCEVGRGHAARHVEGEDDRALDARHADDGLGPGERQDDQGRGPATMQAAGIRRRHRPAPPADAPPAGAASVP